MIHNQEEGGINLYAYVNSNPMGYVDPDGRISVGFRIGGFGVTGGYNPSTGYRWMRIRGGLGTGFGFGADFADNGNGACGTTVGAEVYWSATFDGVGVSGHGESVGLDISEDPSNDSLSPNLSFNATSAGVDIGAGAGLYLQYGAKGKCGCSKN
ncbi:hypothetical protein ACXJY6_05215 [Vibrio sp. RC27]